MIVAKVAATPGVPPAAPRATRASSPRRLPAAVSDAVARRPDMQVATK